MFEAHVEAHHDEKYDLFRRTFMGLGVTFCFLFQDDAEPRKRRRAMLGAMCFVARGKIQENHKVLGIGTEKKIRPECSYDFCLLDIPEWTEGHQQDMEQVQKETGILVSPDVIRIKESEYPSVPQTNREEREQGENGS